MSSAREDSKKISDREILIGIFQLLTKLTERLTGERPAVTIGLTDDLSVDVYGSDHAVTFRPTSEQSNCDALFLGEPCKPPSLPRER